MIIIGAGMAGLIAAHHFRRFKPVIIEAQPSMPHNHTAVLRFRSPAIGHLTGVPFRRVRVDKAVFSGGKVHTSPTLRDFNQYAQKVSGTIASRSIGNIDPCERWIAPDNFVDLMAKGLPATIQFGQEFDMGYVSDGCPIISTIPMHSLAAATASPNGLHCTCTPVHTITADLGPDCDVYQTVYAPEPELGWYRASITGRKLIVEGAGCTPIFAGGLPDCLASVFGIQANAIENVQHNIQRMGKICDVDDAQRKSFIVRMTHNFHIYSLGRFACWRHTMLDDLVGDLQVIDSIITHGSNYGAMIRKDRG